MSNPSGPTQPLPEFDQVVEGNIDIKQLSKNKYKITFSKIRKILEYQVWSNSSTKLNDNRSVYIKRAKEWVSSYFPTSKKPFEPSTVLTINNKRRYIFVIKKAKVKKDGKIIFYISTGEINLHSNISKKILRLPEGYFKNARFDIDKYDLVAGCPGCDRLTPGCAFCCAQGYPTPPSFCPGPSPVFSYWCKVVDSSTYCSGTPLPVIFLPGYPINAFWDNIIGDWYALMTPTDPYEASWSMDSLFGLSVIGYALMNCSMGQLVLFSDFNTLAQNYSTLANQIESVTVSNAQGENVSAKTLFPLIPYSK